MRIQNKYCCSLTNILQFDYIIGPQPAVGETVNGTGCAQWIDGCCQWKVTGLRAKNCSSYLVYYLKPAPTCNLAYCTGKK